MSVTIDIETSDRVAAEEINMDTTITSTAIHQHRIIGCLPSSHRILCSLIGFMMIKNVMGAIIYHGDVASFICATCAMFDAMGVLGISFNQSLLLWGLVLGRGASLIGTIVEFYVTGNFHDLPDWWEPLPWYIAAASILFDCLVIVDISSLLFQLHRLKFPQMELREQAV